MVILILSITKYFNKILTAFCHLSFRVNILTVPKTEMKT
ncbi:hypothetical protein FHX64_002002 [Microbacter margulisiae]|uniref:Uncharacterized protein n=1 Tax=Microbacter margulisiae TaxID=1350067 RepID=A0A7W5H2Q3_9PORP|nr:hypothetical protein [Microbacter margulisiae]